MPELPDLQVFSANLNKTIKGKKVTSITAPVAKKLNVPVAEVKKGTDGQEITKVYREGKELHLLFSNDNVLALHLMLHGSLYLFEEKNTHKHTVLEMHFADGTGLALTDWQAMATPTWNPPEKTAPDAMSGQVNDKFLAKALKGKGIVKNVLLDQKVIRGIGNAYADEILWDAGISPFSVSNKIPPGPVKALAKSIHKVLKDAEKQIKKSHPGIISGEVRDFLLIHNAKKKESPGGAAIEQKTAGGRKTYYTSEQELFK